MQSIWKVRWKREGWTRAPKAKVFRQRRSAEKFIEQLELGVDKKGRELAPLVLVELVPGFIRYEEPDRIVGVETVTPDRRQAKMRFDHVTAPSATEAAELIMSMYPGGLIDLMLPALSDYAWEDVPSDDVVRWAAERRVLFVEGGHAAFGSVLPD